MHRRADAVVKVGFLTKTGWRFPQKQGLRGSIESLIIPNSYETFERSKLSNSSPNEIALLVRYSGASFESGVIPAGMKMDRKTCSALIHRKEDHKHVHHICWQSFNLCVVIRQRVLPDFCSCVLTDH
jgi:hypothetical protein